MHVNEPGRDAQPSYIKYLLSTSSSNPTDGHNTLVFYSDISSKPGITGAVDDFSTAEYQLVLRLFALGKIPGS